MSNLTTRKVISSVVGRIIDETPIVDIHTHIYSPAFGELLLWGVDELIVYHYLVAEVFRQKPIPYSDFWKLSKSKKAEHIWEQLFIKRSPLSESCRGVLTTLNRLGLDVGKRDLPALRSYFESKSVEEHVDTVFKAANVNYVVMTNNPFDEQEKPVWNGAGVGDDRFRAALRLDDILNDWPKPLDKMQEQGYDVSERLNPAALAEVRRFLGDWVERMGALYMAVSLPPSFRFPEDSARGRLIEQVVLPVAQERGIPFAMMIGVKKLVNPSLQLAGDSVGRADNDVVEYLCREYPDNRFMLTYLSRENQHESCVTARKFHNLMLFGCWWYMNNPCLINEITRMRLELLGTSFIPQHSDARVLDQLVYKWEHSRRIIEKILVDKYADLTAAGWTPTEDEIKRDISDLFGGNFEKFLKGVPTE